MELKQNTGVVYRLDCENCEQVYIGQTKRNIETRIKEHKNNIKNASRNYSVVTNHRRRYFTQREKQEKKRDSGDVFYQKIQEK